MPILRIASILTPSCLDPRSCCTVATCISRLLSMAAGGFWKPGTAGPASSTVDRESEAETSFVVYNPNATRGLQEQRRILPIYSHSTSLSISLAWIVLRTLSLAEDQILYLLENYQVVIIVGSTGSGKTTRTSVSAKVHFLSVCPFSGFIPVSRHPELQTLHLNSFSALFSQMDAP